MLTEKILVFGVQDITNRLIFTFYVAYNIIQLLVQVNEKGISLKVCYIFSKSSKTFNNQFQKIKIAVIIQVPIFRGFDGVSYSPYRSSWMSILKQ